MALPLSFSSTFQLFDASKSKPEATINMGYMAYNSRDFVGTKERIQVKNSVFFECHRTVKWLNQKVFGVFLNAIRGDACVDMQANNTCNHERGPTGHMRGALAECRCDILDRKQRDTRLHYENKVLETILQILGSKTPFHIKLAICNSGKLLEEQILLFRLIHELTQKKCEGTIELFLIDPCYLSLNQGSNLEGEFFRTVGEQNDIQQFITEISQCLPENISVKGRFFESAELYIELARSQSAYKPDLLIGTDYNTSPDFGRIETVLKNLKASPIIQTSTGEFPVTHFQYSGDLKTCYKMDGGGAASIKHKLVHERLNVNLIVGIAMAVLLGCAYFRGPQK